MRAEALTGRVRGQLMRSLRKRRLTRLVVEAGYDAIAWIGGLLLAARTADDFATVHMSKFALLFGGAGIGLIVTGCGLAAGLYRGRYLRGSRDEVAAVALASVLTACCLAVAGLALVTGQRALPEAGLGASFAVVAMLGARYVAFAARQRSRTPPAPTAEKIIVFGA